MKKDKQRVRRYGTRGAQIATGFLFSCILAAGTMLILALIVAIPGSRLRNTSTSYNDRLTNTLVGTIHQGVETALPSDVTVAAVRSAVGTGDFTLLATPDVKSTPNDTAIAYDIRTVRSDGFVKPIRISVENLPESIAATINPELIEGTSEIATIELNIPTDAPRGDYQFTVVATADGLQKKTDAIFFVSDLALSNAQLLELKPMETGTEWQATIGWQTDGRANSWVEYAPDAYFTSNMQKYSFTAVDQQNQEQHSITLTYLEPDTVYHYRMRSIDASNNIAVGSDREFITANAE